MLTSRSGSRSFGLGRLGCWSGRGASWGGGRFGVLLGLLLEDVLQLAPQVVESVECCCGVTRQLAWPRRCEETQVDLRTPGIFAVDGKEWARVDAVCDLELMFGRCQQGVLSSDVKRSQKELASDGDERDGVKL